MGTEEGERKQRSATAPAACAQQISELVHEALGSYSGGPEAPRGPQLAVIDRDSSSLEISLRKNYVPTSRGIVTRTIATHSGHCRDHTHDGDARGRGDSRSLLTHPPSPHSMSTRQVTYYVTRETLLTRNGLM
eukprot:354094-Pleurochrysis_carterae.AAC.1